MTYANATQHQTNAREGVITSRDGTRIAYRTVGAQE